MNPDDDPHYVNWLRTVESIYPAIRAALLKEIGVSDESEAKKQIRSCAWAVGLMLIGILTGPLSALLEGYVFVRIWEWFVRPMWGAAPDLSAVLIGGLFYLVPLLRGERIPEEDSDQDAALRASGIRIAGGFLHPAAVLLGAWMLKSWFLP